jgi:hypothetical protein
MLLLVVVVVLYHYWWLLLCCGSNADAGNFGALTIVCGLIGAGGIGTYVCVCM